MGFTHKCAIASLRRMFPCVVGFNREQYIILIKQRGKKYGTILNEYLLFLLETDLREDVYAKMHNASLLSQMDIIDAYFNYLKDVPRQDSDFPIRTENCIEIVEKYTGKTVDLTQYRFCENQISNAYCMIFNKSSN